MDMKELHTIETNAGHIIVTTSYVDIESTNDPMMKLFDDAYVCKVLNDNISVIGNSVEQSLQLIKSAYQIRMEYWLKNQLHEIGIKTLD